MIVRSTDARCHHIQINSRAVQEPLPKFHFLGAYVPGVALYKVIPRILGCKSPDTNTGHHRLIKGVRDSAFLRKRFYC
jgi:hypothetical protein